MRTLLACLCVAGLPILPAQLHRLQSDLDSLLSTLSADFEDDVSIKSEKLGMDSSTKEEGKPLDEKEEAMKLKEEAMKVNKRITEKIFFDVSVDGKKAGRIVLGMYGNAVPKTVAFFRDMVKGQKTKPLKDSVFHSIMPGFVIKGGELEEKMEDENYLLGHDEPGTLSMDNDDNGGSSFFITTQAYPHLDGQHVVFGKVLEGMKLVETIQHYGDNNGTPLKKVAISNTGVMWTDQDDAFIGSSKIAHDDVEFQTIDQQKNKQGEESSESN